MELVPSFALFRGLYELAQYASLAQYKVPAAPEWQRARTCHDRATLP